MTARCVRLGIVGLGRAATGLLPSLLAHPCLEIAAVTDRDRDRAARFAADMGCRAYVGLEQLVADPSVDAVYVATPHECHADDAVAVARAGKHVLVEKPMALSLPACHRMVEAAESAGVHLLIGPTHGADPLTQVMRRIVASGRFGRLRMLWTGDYTDFLYRPRRPEELRTELGGGVLFNQLPHHVDVLRTVHGTGEVRSVRAFAGAWDPARPTEGAYTALLDFADGTAASLTYSGYARFDTDEWFGWVAESGADKDPHRNLATRASLARMNSPSEEAELKHSTGYTGPESILRRPADTAPRAHFGLLIASLDGADLVTTPDGVAIHHDHGLHVEPVAGGVGVLDELCTAVRDGCPPLHDGQWGTATVAVCLAVLHSSRTRREVLLDELPTDAGPGLALR